MSPVPRFSPQVQPRLPEHARILIVLSALKPAGGTEQAASSLANRWAERGHEVTICTMEDDGTPAFHRLDPMVRVQRLGVPNTPASRLRAFWKSCLRVVRIRREIRRMRPDVVISFLRRINVSTLLAAAGLRVPVIVSERNNPDLQRFGPVWDWLQHLTYPRAFGLVAMTRGALDRFPHYPKVRRWVIPNQVSLPQDLSPHPDGRTVTAVGRLVAQKGFDLLLEAFALVSAAHPDWRLVIWGEGPAREALEAQRDRLGLAGKVFLPGVSASPGEWIETTDIFVLSSRYEGWGIVLMEAMAAGLPVVSFNCSFGPSDMITHLSDGVLVRNGDVPGLAAKLSRLIADEGLRARLAASAKISAARFDPARVMARWDGVLMEALDRRSGPADAADSVRNAASRSGPLTLLLPCVAVLIGALCD